MNKIIQTCRQGFSLLEVLVSVFVVLVGLLGVATMIPAGRYEILQARKADMGANLSRAAVNCVVSQISKGCQLDSSTRYFVVAKDNSNLADRLKTGIKTMDNTLQDLSANINDNRLFNGNDDVSIMEADDNQMKITLSDNEALGTGHYSAFATIVPMGNGFWEITGLTVYRYNEDDKSNIQRGSYVFCKDADAGERWRWFKVENIYVAARGGSTITTAVGEKNSTEVKYLGEIVGICRKVVRIDNSYSSN